MLGGVPAHLALALAAIGSVAGFGLMVMSKLLGIGVVVLTVGAWACLGFAYTQDRVAVLVAKLRVRYRFAERITSYGPGYQRVRVE